jgi:hypothetical protein
VKARRLFPLWRQGLSGPQRLDLVDAFLGVCLVLGFALLLRVRFLLLLAGIRPIRNECPDPHGDRKKHDRAKNRQSDQGHDAGRQRVDGRLFELFAAAGASEGAAAHHVAAVGTLQQIACHGYTSDGLSRSSWGAREDHLR